MTLLENLRDHLVDADLVRAPDVAGAGARPWLPPCWRHPDEGPFGPGDAADQKRAPTTFDDGLVVSLMWAPGIPSVPGAEERRIDCIDIVMRADAGAKAVLFEQALRVELLGGNPGGRCDWTMAGLYVIQSRIWSPFQPRDAVDDVFTFSIQYSFETRAL